MKNALSCSSHTVLHAPAFVGVTTKGPELLPHFLCEQTNQRNPCKAEYRFQSIRFNNILDTGLEETAQLRVHLSLTLWEGQYTLLYPQLKLDCLFQYLALSGTCLGEGICTGRLPQLRQVFQPSPCLIYWIQYLWDGEKQEGKKNTYRQGQCHPFAP